MAIAASEPMMATTTRSSISVKPASRCRAERMPAWSKPGARAENTLVTWVLPAGAAPARRVGNRLTAPRARPGEVARSMEPCQPERSAWHRRALSTAAALAAPGGADPGQWTARASTTAPATRATRAGGRELLGQLPLRHHGRGRPGREHARPGPVDRGPAGQADRQGADQARHRRERRPREAGPEGKARVTPRPRV